MVQDFSIDNEDTAGCSVRIGSCTLHVTATRQQLESLLKQDRPAVQTALPDATADEREFLISGMVPSKFDEVMGRVDDD